MFGSNEIYKTVTGCRISDLGRSVH